MVLKCVVSSVGLFKLFKGFTVTQLYWEMFNLTQVCKVIFKVCILSLVDVFTSFKMVAGKQFWYKTFKRINLQKILFGYKIGEALS
jgi:hypothetical protein